MLSEQPYESSRTGEDHHFPDEVTEAERKKNSKVRDQELLFASQARVLSPLLQEASPDHSSPWVEHPEHPASCPDKVPAE